MSGDQEELPAFPKSLCENLADYAHESHEKDLDEALQEFDNFFVTTETKKDHLKAIANGLNNESNSCFVYELAVRRRDDKAVSQFKKLLSFGIFSDRVDPHVGWRPSHACSLVGNWKVAEVLAACRCDLEAVNSWGQTPEVFAQTLAAQMSEKKDDCLEVARIWRKARVEGFPTIAQLASENKFWAVRNLLHREVVADEEKLENFEGKTAVEWAVHHGEAGFAEELRFLLGVRNEPVLPTPTQQPSNQPDCLAETVSKLTEENTDLKLQLESLKNLLDERESRIGRLEERIEQEETERKAKDKRLRKRLTSLTTQVEQNAERMSEEIAPMASELQKQRDFMLELSPFPCAEEIEELTEQVGCLRSQLELLEQRESNVDELEKQAEKMKREKKKLKNQVETLSAQLEETKDEMKEDMEMMKSEWEKKQEIWDELFKALQAQLAIMPGVISSSVASAVSVFQPPDSKRARLTD